MKCIRAAYEYWQSIVTRSQYICCALRIYSYAAQNIRNVAKVLKRIARHTDVA